MMTPEHDQLATNLLLARRGLPELALVNDLTMKQRIKVLSDFGLSASVVSEILNVPKMRVYNERSRYKGEDDLSMP